jgi:hypothetical protein
MFRRDHNLHRVESAAARQAYPTDDFICVLVEGVRMLKDHLCSKNNKNDNFISWTSSLVFALKHAIHEFAGGKNPSTNDTMIRGMRMVDSGLFIPRTTCLQVCDIHNHPEVRLDREHGRYLSQGILDLINGDAIVTTLEDLVQLGLGNLYPPLTQDAQMSHLYIDVQRVREAIMHGQKPVPTDNEWRSATRIAFSITKDRRFRLIILTLLLSLKPTYRFEPTTLTRFYREELG